MQLTAVLLDYVSRALDLKPETALGPYHSGAQHVSTMLRYPNEKLLTAGIRPIIRTPSHADLSTLTILFQDGTGGLQVADPSTTTSSKSAVVDAEAKFIDIAPVDDTTVFVTAGTLLRRWTNGLYPQCVHRVVVPHPSYGDSVFAPERISFVHFAYPNEGTMVTPLPSLCSASDPTPFVPYDAAKALTRKRQEIKSVIDNPP